MCTLTLSAYKRGCKAQGGISDVWLIDKSEREASDITYDTTTTPGAVAIASTTGGVSAYHWIPDQDTWSVTQAATDDNVAGTSFVTQSLQGVLRGYTTALAALADQIRKGRMEACVKFVDGTFIMMGIEARGLQSNGGDHGMSGQALGDNYGFNFVLTMDAQFTAPILPDFAEFTDAFSVVEPIA